MKRSVSLVDCRAARVSRDGLAALAPWRRLKGLRVVETADAAWISWDGEMPTLIQALLPVVGVVFYSSRDGHWRPFDAALPDFAVPLSGPASAADHAIVPAPLAPLPPPHFEGKRVSVTLVPSEQPRPTTALRCPLDVLRRWCEQATTHDIRQLQAAICGLRVWLRGEQLPPLPDAERFWGKRVLTPLGMRRDPDWPDNPLRLAAIVDDDKFLVLTQAGPEALPVAAFRTLTRAAVRRLESSLEVSR